jgi:hypothetical protein
LTDMIDLGTIHGYIFSVLSIF